MKIKNINLDLIKKLPWIIKQPLSQKPENSKSTISDLFVWIKNRDIKTEYEILDLPNLFNKEIKKVKSNITLFVFDKNGKEILKKNILIEPYKRTLLKISELVTNKDADYGTFSIFHNSNPKIISEIGSFITDRGYVKYFINSLDIYKYVHGNLDAISFDGNIYKNLGTTSFLKRYYNFQFKITKNVEHKFYLVNFTNKKQHYELRSLLDNRIIEKINISPKGAGILNYLNSSKNDILTIKSNSVMSRPLVYVKTNKDFDFFHG
tara:strand:- start:2518 stop:3309 length:792 start_codon:yes stop_codon:yes gene_type:complete